MEKNNFSSHNIPLILKNSCLLNQRGMLVSEIAATNENMDEFMVSYDSFITKYHEIDSFSLNYNYTLYPIELTAISHTMFVTPIIDLKQSHNPIILTTNSNDHDKQIEIFKVVNSKKGYYVLDCLYQEQKNKNGHSFFRVVESYCAKLGNNSLESFFQQDKINWGRIMNRSLKTYVDKRLDLDEIEAKNRERTLEGPHEILNNYVTGSLFLNPKSNSCFKDHQISNVLMSQPTGVANEFRVAYDEKVDVLTTFGALNNSVKDVKGIGKHRVVDGICFVDYESGYESRLILAYWDKEQKVIEGVFRENPMIDNTTKFRNIVSFYNSETGLYETVSGRTASVRGDVSFSEMLGKRSLEWKTISPKDLKKEIPFDLDRSSKSMVKRKLA